MAANKNKRVLFLSVAIVAILILSPLAYIEYSNYSNNLTYVNGTATGTMIGDMFNATGNNPVLMSNTSSVTHIFQKGYRTSTLNMTVHGFEQFYGIGTNGSAYVMLNMTMSGFMYGKIAPKSIAFTMEMNNPPSGTDADAFYIPIWKGEHPVNMSNSQVQRSPTINTWIYQTPINVSVLFLNRTSQTLDATQPFYYLAFAHIQLEFNFLHDIPFNFTLKAFFGGIKQQIGSTLILTMENTGGV